MEPRSTTDPEDQQVEKGERDEGGSDEGGQVSEAENMQSERPETPISDSQSVAGQPDGESGRADEGPTGPNSRAGSNRN